MQALSRVGEDPALPVCLHPRCVVMVGMPYPNIKSPELREKMAYLDQTLVSTSSVRRMRGEGRDCSVAPRTTVHWDFPPPLAVCQFPVCSEGWRRPPCPLEPHMTSSYQLLALHPRSYWSCSHPRSVIFSGH